MAPKRGDVFESNRFLWTKMWDFDNYWFVCFRKHPSSIGLILIWNKGVELLFCFSFEDWEQLCLFWFEEKGLRYCFVIVMRTGSNLVNSRDCWLWSTYILDGQVGDAWFQLLIYHRNALNFNCLPKSSSFQLGRSLWGDGPNHQEVPLTSPGDYSLFFEKCKSKWSLWPQNVQVATGIDSLRYVTACR